MAKRKQQQLDRKRRSEAKHAQDLTDEEVNFWRRGSLRSGDRIELGGSRRGSASRPTERRRKGSFKGIRKTVYDVVVFNPIIVRADRHVKDHLWPTAWLCAIDELRRTMTLARLTGWILLLPLSVGLTLWDQPFDVAIEFSKFAVYPIVYSLFYALRTIFDILESLEERLSVLAMDWTATLVEHWLWPSVFVDLMMRGVRLVDFTVGEMPLRLLRSVYTHTAEYWVLITTYAVETTLVIAAWGLFYPYYFLFAMWWIFFTVIGFCAHGLTMHGVLTEEHLTSRPMVEGNETESSEEESPEEEDGPDEPTTTRAKADGFKEAWLWLCRNNVLQLSSDPVVTNWDRIRPRLMEVPQDLIDQAMDLLLQGENRLDVLQNLLGDDFEIGARIAEQDEEQDGQQLEDLLEHYVPPPTWVDPLDQCARSVNDDPPRATRMPSFMGRFRRAWTYWMHEFAPDLAQDDLEVKWLAMVHYLDDLERRSRDIVLYMLRRFEGHENLDAQQTRDEIFNVLWEREPPALSPRATRRNSVASQRGAPERPPTPERHDSDSQLERAINAALLGSESTSDSAGGVPIQTLTNGDAPDSSEEDEGAQPEDALPTQQGQDDDAEPMPQVTPVDEESYSGFLGPVEESESGSSSKSHFPSFSIDWSLQDAQEESSERGIHSPQPKRISTNLVDILDGALEKSRNSSSSIDRFDSPAMNAEELAELSQVARPAIKFLRQPDGASEAEGDQSTPTTHLVDHPQPTATETSSRYSRSIGSSGSVDADAAQNRIPDSPDANVRDATNVEPSTGESEAHPVASTSNNASADGNTPPDHNIPRPTAWSSQNPWGKRSKIPNKPNSFCGWVGYILGFAACGLCAIIQVVTSKKQPGVSPETVRNPTRQTTEISEMQPLVGNEVRQRSTRSESQALDTVDEGQWEEVEEIEGVEPSGEEGFQMSGSWPAAEPANLNNTIGLEPAAPSTPQAERTASSSNVTFSPTSTAAVRSLRMDGPSDSPTPRRSGEPMSPGNDPASAFSDSSDEISRPTRIVRFARRRKNKVKMPTRKKRQEPVERQGSLGVDHSWSASASEADASRPSSQEVRGTTTSAPAAGGQGSTETPSSGVQNASVGRQSDVEPRNDADPSGSTRSARAKGKQPASNAEDPLSLREVSSPAASGRAAARGTVDEYFLPSTRYAARTPPPYDANSSPTSSEQAADVEHQAALDGTPDMEAGPSPEASEAIDDPSPSDSCEKANNEISRQSSPTLGAGSSSKHVRLPNFPTHEQAKAAKSKAFAPFHGPPSDTDVRDFFYEKSSVAHELEEADGGNLDVPHLELGRKGAGDAGEGSVEQRDSVAVVEDDDCDPPGTRCSPS